MPPVQTSEQEIHPPVLITILILLAGIFGFIKVYDYLHTSTFPRKDQPSPSTFQLAEWKTYRNEQYGFEVKYPAEFSPNEELNAASKTTTFDNFNHKYDHGGIAPRGGKEVIIFSQPAPSVLDSFIDNQFGNVEKTDIVVNGAAGKLVKLEGGDGPDLPGSEVWAYIVRGNLLWTINYRVAEFQFTKANDDTFNQILSTFKFIK